MPEDVSIRIRVGVDSASLNASKQGMTALQRRFAGLRTETQRMYNDLDEVRKMLMEAGEEADKTSQRVGFFQSILERFRQLRAKISSDGGDGGGGESDRKSTIGQLRESARLLRGLGQAGVDAASQLIGPFTGLVTTLTQLGNTIGPATLATAALTAAATIFNHLAEQAARRYREISDATLRQVRVEEMRLNLREKGASEDILKESELLQTQRAILERGLKQLLIEQRYQFASLPQNKIVIGIGEIIQAVRGGAGESLLDLLANEARAIVDMTGPQLLELAKNFDGAKEVAGELAQVLDKLALYESEIANIRAREARQAEVELALSEQRLKNEALAAGARLDTTGLASARSEIVRQINDVNRLLDALANFGEENEFAQKAINDLNKQLSDLRVKESYLVTITAPLVEAREREAQAQKQAITEMQRAIKVIEDEAAARRLARTATSESIAARRDEISQEIITAQRVIDALRSQASGNEEARKKIEEYTQKIQDLRAETERLTRITEPLVRQREQEAMMRQSVERRNEAIINAVLNYDRDVERIEQDAYRQRANIQQRYNDTLVNIAKRAAEDAANALQRLNEKRIQLQRSFAQSESDALQRQIIRRIEAQIDFQRAELKAAQDHAARLEEIRRNAQRREEDLILNRDFAALFKSRRDTGFALEDANREAMEASRERARKFAEQEADAAAAYERERQLRAAKFAQDLADAQAQYVKERQLAEQKRAEALQNALIERNQAIQQARENANALLQERRAALQRELADAADFGRRKIEVERAALERGLQMIGATIDRFTANQLRRLSAEIAAAQQMRTRIENPSRMPLVVVPRGSGSGIVQRRASGGNVQAGGIYLVNEPGSSRREGFNNIPFPPMMGLFIPQTSGVVNKDTGSNSISLTFNVTGAQEPQVTAQAIQQVVVQTLQRLLA